MLGSKICFQVPSRIWPHLLWHIFFNRKVSSSLGKGFMPESWSLSSLFHLWWQSLFSIKCRCVSCSGFQLLTTKGRNKRASVLRWFQNKVKCYISCSHITSSDFALEDSITSHTTRERLCAEMSGLMRQGFLFCKCCSFPQFSLPADILLVLVHSFAHVSLTPWTVFI